MNNTPDPIDYSTHRNDCECEFCATPKPIESLDRTILFMAILGWTYGKYDDQCFHIFDKSGNNTMTLKTAQALEALTTEREREARLRLWHEILGVDFDQFYPTDNVHDFIIVPSHWINQHISEDNMKIPTSLSTQKRDK